MPQKNGNGTLTLRALEHFYLEAIARGYVAGATPAPCTDMPGVQLIVNETGKLRLTDQWIESADNRIGTTTIWYDGKPVWFMQYHGWYDKEALPFIRACRQRAYERNLFHGGLGHPVDFQDAFGYTYTNTVRRGSSMADFATLERVHHQARVSDLGYQEAHGRLLVTL